MSRLGMQVQAEITVTLTSVNGAAVSFDFAVRLVAWLRPRNSRAPAWRTGWFQEILRGEQPERAASSHNLIEVPLSARTPIDRS